MLQVMLEAGERGAVMVMLREERVGLGTQLPTFDRHTESPLSLISPGNPTTTYDSATNPFTVLNSTLYVAITLAFFGEKETPAVVIPEATEAILILDSLM